MTTTHKGLISALAVGSVLFVGSPTRAQTPSGTTAQEVHGAPASPEGSSQTAPSQLAPEENLFRVELTVWAWLMGMDGDVGVRGKTAKVGESFVDLLDESDSIMALSGRMELGYGRFGIFADALYADLGVDGATGPDGLANVNVDFQQTIVDFGFMYRVGDWEPAGDAARNPRRTTLDLYAGGRYLGLELDLRPALEPEVSGRQDILDPIVGAKLVLPFAEQWHLAVNGDIGGFGVESDLTWSTTAVVGFDFHMFGHPASVMAGYRAIGWDYSSGSGAEEFTWDLVEHGAILGFALQF